MSMIVRPVTSPRLGRSRFVHKRLGIQGIPQHASLQHFTSSYLISNLYKASRTRLQLSPSILIDRSSRMPSPKSTESLTTPPTPQESPKIVSPHPSTQHNLSPCHTTPPATSKPIRPISHPPTIPSLLPIFSLQSHQVYRSITLTHIPQHTQADLRRKITALETQIAETRAAHAEVQGKLKCVIYLSPTHG